MTGERPWFGDCASHYWKAFFCLDMAPERAGTPEQRSILKAAERLFSELSDGERSIVKEFYFDRAPALFFARKNGLNDGEVYRLLRHVEKSLMRESGLMN